MLQIKFVGYKIATYRQIISHENVLYPNSLC